jgi:glycosyltransferase involved in cell wall biosynthesis
MKKIKILRIITRLNIGGPAIHAALLTKELNDDEFESVLMYGSISRGEGDMGYAAEARNIKSLQIPELKRNISFFSDIRAFYRILKYIREYKPQIVHTHTAKAGTLGRIAAILANVPVRVHTFHGNVFHGYFGRLTTRLFILAEKILAQFSDAIIVISDKQKEELVNKYKITTSEKCHVIRLGFELGPFLASEGKKNIFRKKSNFKEDDILVGIVGRLTAIKNHKMFIDSARHACLHAGRHARRALAEKLKFIIIGDGELKSELLAYTRFRGLEKKMFFTGWVKDMDEVYADLNIIALTSISEGTPVSIIEAMAASRPVISTDVGGVKDALGQAGVLVKSGDFEAMGDKISELASSLEKRERFGFLARDTVRGIYSKERLVSELKQLYKKLSAERR